MRVKIFLIQTLDEKNIQNTINEWMSEERYPIIRFIQQSYDDYTLIISVWYEKL